MAWPCRTIRSTVSRTGSTSTPRWARSWSPTRPSTAVPEELLLTTGAEFTTTLLRRSNLVGADARVLNDAHVARVQAALRTIHSRFRTLYGVGERRPVRDGDRVQDHGGRQVRRQAGEALGVRRPRTRPRRSGAHACAATVRDRGASASRTAVPAAGDEPTGVASGLAERYRRVVTVASVEITSAPSLDTDGDSVRDSYGRGDVIKVTVTWSAGVRSGPVPKGGSGPFLRLDVGGATRKRQPGERLGLGPPLAEVPLHGAGVGQRRRRHLAGAFKLWRHPRPGGRDPAGFAGTGRLPGVHRVLGRSAAQGGRQPGRGFSARAGARERERRSARHDLRRGPRSPPGTRRIRRCCAWALFIQRAGPAATSIRDGSPSRAGS